MTDIRLERVPPQDMDAERAALGAMLIPEVSREVISKAIPIIKEDDFYRLAHQSIFRAIQKLFDAGIPVDYVTLTKGLEEDGSLEKVGGVTYLVELSDSVPSAANIEHYCRIIRELSIRRKLIMISATTYNDCFDDSIEFKDLMSDVEREIIRLRMGDTNGSLRNMKDVLKGTFKHIQALYEKKETIIGQSTGIMDLDTMTSGFMAGDYIIIGGRPGMGKSTLAQNIIQHVAFDLSQPCLIFSAEMNAESLVLRIISSEARISMHRIRTGSIHDNEWAKLVMAASRISEGKIFVDDVPGSVADIIAKSHRMIAEHDIKLIVVDYIQLIKMEGRMERRHEVEEVSASFKRLAKELKVPVIVVSQLSRSVESRVDKRPILSDLRESGNIEQDADIVMFLYRDDYYRQNKDDPAYPNDYAELIVRKQRNGPTGTVKLVFDSALMTFRNMEMRLIQ